MLVSYRGRQHEATVDFRVLVAQNVNIFLFSFASFETLASSLLGLLESAVWAV